MDPRSLTQENEPRRDETGTNEELEHLERERAEERRDLEKERAKRESEEKPRPDLRG
ncbi:MAG: hypothetical protein ACRD2J_05475 [Thermoanaerobaculia bacterium]